jgi:hypothetical protein
MPDSLKNAQSLTLHSWRDNRRHGALEFLARLLFGSCCSIYGLVGQQVDALAAVKQKVSDDLAKLPNYVCTETVEQSRVRAGGCPAGGCVPENINRTRIDVGYSKGKQIFGWPGGESLSESDVSRLVPGLITDGDLVTIARLLLLSEPAITSVRQEDRNGRATVRYDYRVPLDTSGWVLRYADGQIKVPYRGSFWVEPSSLDVVELVMTPEDFPPIWSVDRTLQYTRARIGTRDFLLPERAVLLRTDSNGNKITTEARFSNCRQYTAESFLHFPSDGASPTRGMQNLNRPNVPLPDDFIVEVTLATEIDSDNAAVGDPVAASLRRKVDKRRTIPLPSGSMLHGRISQLQAFGNHRYVDILFNYLEFDSTRIDIRSRRNQLVSKHKDGWLPGGIRVTGRRIHLLPRHRLFLRSTVITGG